MQSASGATGRGHVVAPSRPGADGDGAVRVLAAVMSTDVTRAAGDLSTIDEGSWPQRLGEYDGIVRRQALRYNGTIKKSGDGTFVQFSSAYSALRCVLAIQQDLHDVGLELRAGLHAAEVDVLDEDMTEVLAHVAGRIRCVAQPGRVLTSRVFGDFVVGSGLVFEDVRGYYLDDVLGEWNLLAVHRSP
jgi:class 3 adenylate cyclase